MQNTIHSDYLSKENTNCLKIIFAIAVVICHIFARNPFGEGLGIGVIITAFGYLSVSCFLFFSGYGLTITYISKGDTYFEGYLKRRVLPLYVIQGCLIIVYTIFQITIGYKVPFSLIIQSFLFGDTVVQYGWYIQLTILFYVAYYFSFYKASIKKGIIRISIIILSFCIACVVFKMAYTWFESSLAFLFGIIWAYKKQKIDHEIRMQKKYVIAVAVAFVGFFFTFVFVNIGVLPNAIRVPVKMLSSIFFITLVLLFVM